MLRILSFFFFLFFLLPTSPTLGFFWDSFGRFSIQLPPSMDLFKQIKTMENEAIFSEILFGRFLRDAIAADEVDGSINDASRLL